MPLWGLFVDVTPLGGSAHTLTSVQDWELTPALDKAGTFQFTCAASDPASGYILPLATVRCYSYENGALIENGSGRITQVTYNLRDVDSLKVSGDDLLGELGNYTVGALTLARVYTRTPAYVWHIITAGYPGSSNAITLPGMCLLGFGDWLYVGDTTDYDTVTITFGARKNSANDIQFQYYSDDGSVQSWLSNSVVALGDETMDGTSKLSLTKSGRIKFSPPLNWGLLSSSYIVRWRAVTGGNITVDLSAITVSGPAPVPDALAQIIELIPQTTTVATVAGGTDVSLTVKDASDLTIGMAIRITLDNGAIDSTVIDGKSTNTLTLHDALPSAVGVGNTVAGPLGWLLDLVLGHNATLTSITQTFTNNSVLSALSTVATMTGEHFRLGMEPRQIVWLQTDTPASGLTFVQAPDGSTIASDDTLALIQSLSAVTDATGMYSRIRPYGNSVGNARIDLAHTSRSAAAGYVLNAAANTITRTAMESWAGRIDSPEQVNANISALAPTPTQLQQAADQLYDWAFDLLVKHSAATAADVPVFCSLTVIKLHAPLYPGDQAALSISRMREGHTYIDLSMTVNVMALSRRVDVTGIRTATLQAASVQRYPHSDLGVLATLLTGASAQFNRQPTAPGLSAVRPT